MYRRQSFNVFFFSSIGSLRPRFFSPSRFSLRRPSCTRCGWKWRRRRPSTEWRPSVSRSWLRKAFLPSWKLRKERANGNLIHSLIYVRTCMLLCFSCASDGLCFPDASGQLFVNPTSRLALKGHCSVEDGSNCVSEMTYYWKLRDQNGNVSIVEV